ncbi:hypothetical protein R1sor_025692 [Riccia sorocarpa]|uniref:Uncharacterized protein n=1 Tax=Riccia sorocarpa TaxID=122646 RepID=A0ABD3GD90_9MARC
MHAIKPFSEPRVRGIHQTWSLRFRCQHGHTYGWSSIEMELYHHIPDITHRQYHAALCAGLGYTQLDSICKEMGLVGISKDHFFAFQRGQDRRVGWIRTTLDQWALKKYEVQNATITRNLHDLNGDTMGVIYDLDLTFLDSSSALVLYADLRYDSTRNGYNGTVVWIDGFDGRVVELVNMTRVEAVDAILRRYGVASQKYLWHWCKNIIKKSEVHSTSTRHEACSGSD